MRPALGTYISPKNGIHCYPWVLCCKKVTYQKSPNSWLLFLCLHKSSIAQVISGLGLKEKILLGLYRFLNSHEFLAGKASARDSDVEHECRALWVSALSSYSEDCINITQEPATNRVSTRGDEYGFCTLFVFSIHSQVLPLGDVDKPIWNAKVCLWR